MGEAEISKATNPPSPDTGLSETPVASSLSAGVSSPNLGDISDSFSVEQAPFEEVSGLKLNPKILEVRAQGHRLVVLVNPPPEEYGLIRLPDKWRNEEKGGSGWVISVGPLVGNGNTPHPSGPLLSHPAALLYKQIIFGAYIGKIIRVEFFNTESKSPYVMMTDRDVWAIDRNPVERADDATKLP